MFLFGAALLKAGLFEPERANWRRRLFFLGLFVGLPACAAGPFVAKLVGPPFGPIIGGLIVALLGPLLSLGYLGGISMLIDRGRCRTLTHSLAMTGRMALTNYLTQSAVATFIFYYYGLALFAQTTPSERVGIVFGVYFVQVLFSVVWMRFFRFGPMEWLWRSLTYMRPQRILRAKSIDVVPATLEL